MTAVRVDGRSEFEPVSDVPGGRPLPDGKVEPLLDQLIDGQDLYYRDVVDLGWRVEWLSSYTDVPGFPYVGVQRRVALIQKARTKLGLPPSENGTSQEYQEQMDRVNLSLGIEAVLAALPFIFRGMGALIGLTRGAFIARSSTVVLEITEITPGFVILTPVTVDAASVIRPTLTPLPPFALDTVSARVAELVLDYRRLQMGTRGNWVEKATRDVIQNQMGDVSAYLGIFAAQGVMLNHLPNMQDATRLCCDGPVSGGGANNKFDEVWRRADGSIVVVEGKGRRHHRDIKGLLSGRKIVVAGDARYALQGTREYLIETAQLMTRPGNDPAVRAAGDEILLRLGEGKVEYYVTRAAFAGKRVRKGVSRGLVWGVSKVVSVWRSAL